MYVLEKVIILTSNKSTVVTLLLTIEAKQSNHPFVIVDNDDGRYQLNYLLIGEN
jgi:hypothetical protein